MYAHMYIYIYMWLLELKASWFSNLGFKALGNGPRFLSETVRPYGVFSSGAFRGGSGFRV